MHTSRKQQIYGAPSNAGLPLHRLEAVLTEADTGAASIARSSAAAANPDPDVRRRRK